MATKKAQINKIYVPNIAGGNDLLHGMGSIFLAGPTPRNKQVKSWRPDFIKALRKTKMACSVFIPEIEKLGAVYKPYEQIEWEYQHLHLATAIAVWVPRDLENLPGFTTNVEFGYWVKYTRMFYGRPNGAPKTRYLDWMYTKERKSKPATSMDELANRICKWIIA